MKTIGNRIAAARASKGWSQKQLADAYPCKPEQISMWERGTRNPRPKAVATLASVLGVTYDWLMADEGPGLPPTFATQKDLEDYMTGGSKAEESPNPYRAEDTQAFNHTKLETVITAALETVPSLTKERVGTLARAITDAYMLSCRPGRTETVEDLVRKLLQ